MSLHTIRRTAGRTSIVALTMSAIAAGTLAAAHPATAAAILKDAASLVSCSTSTACVGGANTASGPGVSASSVGGYGLSATSTYGAAVKAVSSGNIGVAAHTVTKATSPAQAAFGVAGYDDSTSGSQYNGGVYGVSKTGYGVYGQSGSNSAVVAESSSGIGVYSESTASAVYGISVHDAGIAGDGGLMGVFGESESGEGGDFQTTAASANALVANNLDTSNSFTSTAITATTNGDANDTINNTRAIVASNSNGDGLDASGSYIGLVGRAPANGFPMDLVTPGGADLVLVDGAGNTLIGGNLTVNGTINGQLRTATGHAATAFAAKMASPTVEDTGTAQLVTGAAAVRLDPTFAASIDPRVPYRVFVTPNGDTNGLYVAQKAPAGFIVREIHSGRSTLAFDYRIVATTLGDAGKRTALVTAKASTPKVLPMTIAAPRKFEKHARPAGPPAH